MPGNNSILSVNNNWIKKAELFDACCYLVDLFCGVGGLTHGLVRGGIKVTAGIDIITGKAFWILQTIDPATGVMRHADAGYEIALDCARENGLRLPGILGEGDIKEVPKQLIEIANSGGGHDNITVALARVEP